MSKKKIKIFLLFSISLFSFFYLFKLIIIDKSPSKNVKLYWFIPDGVRAEPNLFNVYKWAEEGKLPNIKKLMDRGSYGYSYPVFPSHTPTNFAALLTGSYPETNGVNDGPMHVVGKPLDTVAIGGFRSVARKVPAIWDTLEDVGLKTVLVSIPGSTPPESEKGVVVRGRWGNWGADFTAINYEYNGNLEQRIKQGRGSRLFYFGQQLTEYIDYSKPTDWKFTPETSGNGANEIAMDAYGLPIFGIIYDSIDDETNAYDKLALSLDKNKIFATLSEGEWSDWLPVELIWEVGDETMKVDSNIRVVPIKINKDGFFRIRVLYDNINNHITLPSEFSYKLEERIGPMIDFVDNFPAQLIYYPEDKKIFMDEAEMSFDWHEKAVSTVIAEADPDVVIQDIYTPNQMLTSRWWMGYVDPESSRYNDISDSEREILWNEVKAMYVKIDNIIGEILKNTDKNAYIVFSSDHGNIPLDKYVNLNNLFAQKGWLKFKINSQTGEPIIDWENTKVIYLKMAHVYINPNGLDGNYERASGGSYEELRNAVIEALSGLTDPENGTKPVEEIVKWENANSRYHLDPDRLGDLVITNTPGYGWNEEMSNSLEIFSVPLISGYKQAINAEKIPGMWTPFIMAGPGIKQNNFLGDVPFNAINQYPTIMRSLKVEIPDFVQGVSLSIFENKGN